MSDDVVPKLRHLREVIARLAAAVGESITDNILDDAADELVALREALTNVRTAVRDPSIPPNLALMECGAIAERALNPSCGPEREVREASPAGSSGHSVPASAPLTDDERALCEVIDERDTAHELLDRFAAAIGAMLGEEFGEHSSGNDPWANALEAIEAA